MEALIVPALLCSGLTFFFVLMVYDKLSKVEKMLGRLVSPLELSAAAKLLADDPRQKIAAIKTVREETGVGLAEAKQAVEAYIHSRQAGATDA